MTLPAVFGLSGPKLTEDERSFFHDADPVGYILFARNCVDRPQLRVLTDELRSLAGRDVAILIDQEGGRVARMRPPEWPAFPPGGAFNRLYELAPVSALEAVRCNAEAIGLMLAEVGINVDCLPLLDVISTATHDAIGDRAFGSDPLQVASLGRAALDGLAAAGVTGVIKHMPGQGRATSDTHHALAVVDAAREDLSAADFRPFRQLREAVIGMTAHVVYRAVDPELPATLSPTVIGEVIRGEIGFDGLLLSDDLDMHALSGSIAERAVGCIAAGCDVALNCWGRMDDMVAIAEALPPLSQEGQARLGRVMAGRMAVAWNAERFAALTAKRDDLLALESASANA